MFGFQRGVGDGSLVRFRVGFWEGPLAAEFGGEAVGFAAGAGQFGGLGERRVDRGTGTFDLCFRVRDFLPSVREDAVERVQLVFELGNDPERGGRSGGP